MSKAYEEESADLKIRLSEAQKALASYKDSTSNSARFTKLIKNYFDIKKLDTAMLNELISKIVVYERDVVDGDREQLVDIYYNFVGIINQEAHTSKQRVRTYQVFDPTLLSAHYATSAVL